MHSGIVSTCVATSSVHVCNLFIPHEQSRSNQAVSFNLIYPTHDKTCVTSKDTDQSVHPTSMARVLVLDSLEVVEGTCDQKL